MNWDIVVFWISFVSSIASIAGFAITFWIFLTIRKVTKYYMFVGRVPDLVEHLGEHSRNISRYMQDFDRHTEEIQLELSRIEAILESLEVKVDDKNLKRAIRQLVQNLKMYKPIVGRREDLQTLYTSIHKVINRTELIRKDTMHEWKG